jgi:hypothetical protein
MYDLIQTCNLQPHEKKIFFDIIVSEGVETVESLRDFINGEKWKTLRVRAEWKEKLESVLDDKKHGNISDLGTTKEMKLIDEDEVIEEDDEDKEEETQENEENEKAPPPTQQKEEKQRGEEEKKEPGEKEVRDGSLSVLHLCHAAWTGAQSKVDACLESVANCSRSEYVNDSSVLGFTPLHFAIVGGSTSSVSTLLSSKADVEKRTCKQGLSAVTMSVILVCFTRKCFP